MSDLTNSNQIRQTFNSPQVSFPPTTVSKLRSSNVRRGRSQSHADLRLPSKSPSNRQPQQRQRPSLNGAVDIDDSSIFISPSNDQTTSSLSNMPTSATTTALMMINKQYANNPAPCLPHIMNHHQHNTKSISFYQKRYSEHI
jgi:hypothetical protein